jgi:hypothetical protein
MSNRIRYALATLLFLGCGRQSDRSLRADGPSSAPPSVGHAIESRPVRMSLLTPCDSLPNATCFRDTAFGRSLNHEPGWVVEADWILFASRGDSLELYVATDDSRGHGEPALTTNFGQENDRSGNTTDTKHLRMKWNGIVTLAADPDPYGFLGDSVAYTLHVLRLRPERAAALEPTGSFATLSIVTPHLYKFAVVPASMWSSRGDISNWVVTPNTYRVALVTDSAYLVCRIPCSLPDTVLLRPSARVTKRY